MDGGRFDRPGFEGTEFEQAEPASPDLEGAEMERVGLDQRNVTLIAAVMLGILGVLVLAIVVALIGLSDQRVVAIDSSPSPGPSPSIEASPSPVYSPNSSPEASPLSLVPTPSPTTPVADPTAVPTATATASPTPSKSAPPTAAATVTPAPMAGDDLTDAIIIDRLPFTRTLDTSRATGSSLDANCDGGGPTVWFSYQASQTTHLGVTTEGSDYYTTLALGTRTRSGGFRLIECGYQAMRFEAEAGTTYLFMVGSEEPDDGGTLVFSLGTAPPPPEIELSIDAEGTFDAAGRAAISGTVSCSRRVDGLGLNVSLRQRFDRFVFEGWGEGRVDHCSSQPRPWAVWVGTYNGTFGEGPAAASGNAYIYDGFGSSESSAHLDVVLHSDVPPTPSPSPEPVIEEPTAGE